LPDHTGTGAVPFQRVNAPAFELVARRVSSRQRWAKKRWHTTTIADPAAEAARDLIVRQFDPGGDIDARCVGDITYIATWEGWAYLATVIDLASRRVAGWALANHMRSELVTDANVAAGRRRGRQSWADSSAAAPIRAHSAHGPIAYRAPPMSGPAPVPIVYAAP
jgi:transposase InsO family protein